MYNIYNILSHYVLRTGQFLQSSSLFNKTSRANFLIALLNVTSKFAVLTLNGSSDHSRGPPDI